MHHVGDVREPAAIVRIAHHDAILRIEQHETFRDQFQCILELAPGAVELLAQALFGRDVAGGPRNAAGASGLVATRDAVLACPVPGAIGMAVTVLDFEAFCFSLEVSDNRGTVVRHVIGMDAIEPLLSRREFLGRQRYEIIEARRVVHFTGRDVPLVDSLVDHLHGGRVALLAVAKCLLHASPCSRIADAANEPDRASRCVGRRPRSSTHQTVSIARLDAIFARDRCGFPPEAFP